MIPCLVANQCSVTSLGCTNGSCDLKGITGRVEYFDCAGLDGSNLYLNGNAITSIAPSAFVNAPPSMTTINLNLNSISTLEAGAFTGLSNVISIMLHKNFITTIEAEAFAIIKLLFEVPFIKINRSKSNSLFPCQLWCSRKRILLTLKGTFIQSQWNLKV